ncbi:hypothetical protein Tco_0903237 [Tanacetum coccineum]
MQVTPSDADSVQARFGGVTDWYQEPRIIDAPTGFSSANFPMESEGNMIWFGVDIIRLVPVIPTMMARLDGQEETIRSMQEELRALKEGVERAEIERATLRATVRSLGAEKKWLSGRLKDERESRAKMERQMVLTYEELERLKHSRREVEAKDEIIASTWNLVDKSLTSAEISPLSDIVPFTVDTRYSVELADEKVIGIDTII